MTRPVRLRLTALISLLILFALLMPFRDAYAASATFTVNTTDDVMDENGCDATHCSLREAINAANTNFRLDTITFALPGSAPYVIRLRINYGPENALPAISDPIIIDGRTQPGYSGQPLIVLRGNGEFWGLHIMADDVVIRGLSIGGFQHAVYLENNRAVIQANYIGLHPDGSQVVGNSQSGIYIANTSSGNLIGGPNPEDRNVIAGNGSRGDFYTTAGIEIHSFAANTVQGNLLGTNAAGTDTVTNGDYGIYLLSGVSHQSILDNVISGFTSHGIRFYGGSGNHIIQGNYIGTDGSGGGAGRVNLSNGGYGLYLTGQDVLIGGTGTGEGNVISGNIGGGIYLDYTPGAVIQANKIGTDITGTVPWTNQGPGIAVQGYASPYDTPLGIAIGGTEPGAGNLIMHYAAGVYLLNASAKGITISGNSIIPYSSSAGLGIDLFPQYVNSNDAQDVDTGANQGQNFPILTTATVDASGITISGSLNSTPNTSFWVEFFGNEFCSLRGHGEGQVFLGGINVTTDPAGDAPFVVSLPVSPSNWMISATATDSTYGTSEFSPCIPLYVSPPEASVGIDPRGVVTQAQPAEFSWTRVAGAAQYVLSINNASGNVFTATYDNSTDICRTICRLFDTPVLDNGLYTWKVQAVNPIGTGPWSEPISFEINAPPPPMAISPEGVTDLEPTMVWTEIPITSQYVIRVYQVASPDQGYLEYYFFPASCSEGLCSGEVYIPEEGDYQWNVRADGSRSSNSLTFEARTAAVSTLLVVNTTTDTDDGLCTLSHCSLREAIHAANDSTGVMETIAFDIPGAGPHVIQVDPLNGVLPEITDPATIDGTTEPDYDDAPVVEISGELIDLANYEHALGCAEPTEATDYVEGLTVSAGNTTIKGLAIHSFATGIHLNGGDGNRVEDNYLGLHTNGEIADNTCYASAGGTGILATNSSNNALVGNHFLSASTDNTIYTYRGYHDSIMIVGASNNNVVQGNHIFGPSWGVVIDGQGLASGNLIGGTIPGARNIIATGLGIGVAGASNTTIQGNYIGTNEAGTAAGTALNSGYGIYITGQDSPATGVLIGGTEPGAGNVISGNSSYGIQIRFSTDITIQGNYIGIDASGANPLGNVLDGIVVENDVFDVTIGGPEPGARNIIANNGGAGILLNPDYDSGVPPDPAPHQPASEITIQGNAIYGNDDLGIDIDDVDGGGDGVTPNDADDIDTGVNNLQNFPLLTAAQSSGTSTDVGVAFESAPNTVYHFEFFANTTCDPSGYGEGEQYLEFTELETDGTGNLVYNEVLLGDFTGKYITATATAPDGSTSEFSACQFVGAETLTVNTTADTNDGACRVSHCSLREAIHAANANAGTDTISFDITGEGPHVIQPTSALPAITEAVIIDGTSEPDYTSAPVVVLNGASAGIGVDGLLIQSGGSTVKGLAIHSYAVAIALDTGDGNTLQGNYIGTDHTGMALGANPEAGSGIELIGSSNNLIGGTAGQGNLITGYDYGLYIGAGSDANTVQGNLIGTDVTGTLALGGDYGIFLINPADPPDGNLIGGSDAGARNVISGHDQSGVRAENATALVILGNYIGTDVTGTLPLGNFWYGIHLLAAVDGTVVGGAGAGEGNVISGNGHLQNPLDSLSGVGSGIYLKGTNTPSVDSLTGVVIQGNRIGTDATGAVDLGNIGPGIDGAGYLSSIVVGGLDTGEGNLVSGNELDGVRLIGPSSTDHVIEGNRIGTTADGMGALGNSAHGIALLQITNTEITRNLISGNNTPLISNGIILGSGANNNVITLNVIGLNADQSNTISNANDGIEIQSSTGNQIGLRNAGNIIGGNGGNGILLGPGAINTRVKANHIGQADASDLPVFRNSRNGIELIDADDNRIGDTTSADNTPDDGNIIGGNLLHGIAVTSNTTGGSTGNVISGNFIGTNADVLIDVDWIPPDLGNGGSGVFVSGTGTRNNVIGSETFTRANSILYNDGSGVRVAESANVQNRIYRNRIYANGMLGIDLGSLGPTVNDPGDGDTGANGLQNYPVITSVVNTSSDTDPTIAEISFTLNSTPNSDFVLTFFQSPSCDEFDYGEGRAVLGSLGTQANPVVHTNSTGHASGVFTFSSHLSLSWVITATTFNATDGSAAEDNSSEFSPCVEVLPAAPVTLSPSGSSNSSLQTFTWNQQTNDTGYRLIIKKGTTTVLDQEMLAGDVCVSSVCSFDYSLADGSHTWQVQAQNVNGYGPLSAALSLFIDTTPPPSPTLGSPANNSTVAGMPTFSWYAASTATLYKFQYDDDSNFGSPYEQNVTTTSHKPLTSDAGIFYWRVQALDALGNESLWSAVRTVNVTRPKPPAPTLTAPINGLITNDNTPELTWVAPYGTSSEVQIDDSSTFGSPNYLSGPLGVEIFMPTLPDGKWYWRVRATNELGTGLWSGGRNFTVDTRPPFAPALSSPAHNSGTSDTTPTLTWAASAGTAKFYTIQLSANADMSDPIVTTEVTTLSYTVPNASALPFGQYYWRVQPKDAAGNVGDWSVVRTFYITFQRTPVNGAATMDTTPAFTWAPVSGAQQYELQVSPVVGPVVTYTRTPGQGTSFSIPAANALTHGTYFWRMRVKVNNVWGPPMPIWTLIVTPAPPAAPVLSSPAGGFPTNTLPLELQWNSVTNGMQYQVQVDDSSGFSSPQRDMILDLSDLNYDVDGLIDATYYWRVRALNAYGAPGAWSSSRTFVYDITPPGAPVLSSHANNATVAGLPTFSWNSVSTANFYRMQYDDDSGFGSSYEWTGATVSHKPIEADLGLIYWRVQARDAAGNWGAWSAVRTLTVTIPVPGAPTLNAPGNGSFTNDTTPMLSWNEVPYAETYRVQVDNSQYFTSPIQVNVAPISDSFYVVTPALPQGKWYWRVQATNTTGTGSWSSVRNFTVDTVAPMAPALSSPAQGAGLTDTTPTLTWLSASGASSYNVRLASDQGVIYIDVQRVSTLNITAPILPYGKYFWQVQSIDAAGNIGEWSAPRNFSITIQRTQVDGAITSDTTPTFTRVSLSGATLYRIQISTQDTFDIGFTETYDRTPAQGTSFTLGSGDALGYGVHYWRIGVENTGDGEIDLWMPTWTLYVTNLARPVAPLLALPDDDTVTALLPLTLSWNGVTSGNQYEVQIANNTLFNVPLADQVLGPAVTSYDADSLSDGTYYWRVRGLNTQGAPGAWSGWRSFTVDLP